jgi:hypothetical protein
VRAVEAAGGVFSVVLVVIEASFVPVVVVLVSCAETAHMLASMTNAIAQKRENVLTVFFLRKNLMNTA